MNEYTPYNNTLVAIKEPTVTEIVPKSGPYAGKKTFVVEFQAHHPKFEKNEQGKFQFKESTFYKIQYFGSENAAKRIAAGIKDGMTLEVRGDQTQRQYTAKDGSQKTENIISAKGIAVSLNQPGLEVSFTKTKQKDKGSER